MPRDSVFSDDRLPTEEELIALGREKLIELQNEAARRLDNLRRLYGPGGSGLEGGLQRDIGRIEKALKALDKEEGVYYRPRLASGSREDIAERFVLCRREAIEYRYDEGVDEHKAFSAQRSFQEVQEEIADLNAAGYPLTEHELSAARARVADRVVRMRHGGVRRMEPKTICSTCRATIFSDTVYCPYCGKLVGDKPNKMVFVCYGSPDKVWVTELALSLRKRNIDAWLDEWELPPGSSIQDGVNRAIDNCDVFLFIASKHSLNRRWPQEELKAALNRRLKSSKGLTIIPVLKDKCADVLPAILKDTVHLAFYDHHGKTVEISTGAGKDLLTKLESAIQEKWARP